MHKDRWTELEDIIASRVSRAAVVCFVTMLLAVVSPYPIGMSWLAQIAVLLAVGLLSYGDRTITAALVAPAFFLLLNIAPPELVKQVAAYMRA